MSARYPGGFYTREGPATGIRNNFVGTARPVATDDSSANFAVGSGWVDVMRGNAYVCVDPTLGAAVWTATTIENIFYQSFPTNLDLFNGPAASLGGSNDFIATIWLRPEDIFRYDGFASAFTIFGNSTGANGFLVGWNFGAIQIICHDGVAGPWGPSNIGANTVWGSSELRDKESDVLLVMRVTGGGAGAALLEIFVNERRLTVAGFTAGAAGFTASPGALLIAGDANLYMAEGVAYVNGTRTDAQLSSWMRACIKAGGIVDDGLAWDTLVNSQLPNGAVVAGRWDDQSGNANHFTEGGAPVQVSRRRRMHSLDFR